MQPAPSPSSFQNTFPAKGRIDVVDALRGFAVVAIMLLHFVEHFIYPVYPPSPPPLVGSLDAAVKDAVFFVFAGKSYSILRSFSASRSASNTQSAWRAGVIFAGVLPGACFCCFFLGR